VWLVMGTASVSSAETIRIDIAKLAFSPAQVSARVGDTIEWVNTDFVTHTATARNKEWDITIPAKGTGSVVLKSSGTVDYYCRFHPNMTGTITVEDKSPA
jgi:plastocyanin